MKKFLAKAKSTIQELQDPATPIFQKPLPGPSQNQASSSSSTAQDGPSHISRISPPTPTDLIRYRYHHGVNLGSVFVLEKWLSPSMFTSNDSNGGSELEAVTASISQHGLLTTREKWESHWRNAVSDSDFDWLVNVARCTSIRLPIGYFTLGEGWCVGTPFEKVKSVYVNAWTEVKRFIERARSWGIGVLIDFHAVRGGANGEEHSGTGSGKAELWDSRGNRNVARKALGFIAREVKHGGLSEGVVGIQVINEATHHAKGMYDWYEEVIREIGSVDETIPIYISDAWDLETCLRWINGRHVFRTLPRNPIVVDTHRYYTFSDADRSQSPQQIIGRIGAELSELDGKEGALSDKGEAEVIIGEWSCVLDGQTWSMVRPEEKDDLIKQFGQVQSQKWQHKAGGSYFWTYKMDWMDGGEWGFVEQTKKSNISMPRHLGLSQQEVKGRTQHAQTQRAEMAHAARSAHEGYWNDSVPGKRFEHHLYSEGWELGFSDAQAFFSMRADGAFGAKVAGVGGDKIGCLEIWVKKRLLEAGHKGEFVWEWEQGFRAGVAAFYQCAGI